MLIRSTCRGKYASCDVQLSADGLTLVMGLMEGNVSVFEEKSSGGTDCPTPAQLRHMKFGVNRKIDNLSCTVNLKHVKAGKNETDIFAHKALFDANYSSSLKATGMRMIYGGVR